MIPKKARVGEYIKLGNGTNQQIIRIMPALFSHDEWEYELENGMILMGYEFNEDDVTADREAA